MDLCMLTTTGAISRVFKRGTTIFQRQLLGPFLAVATAAQESYIFFGRDRNMKIFPVQ